MHYVSERPCLINNHVHMVGSNEEEKKQFKNQALKDWETFYLSNELVPGGRFFVYFG